jgi:hypothetical protein
MMESVLLFSPEFFSSLYEKGVQGWMSMARDLGLLYHFVLIIVGLLICYYGYRIYRIVVIALGACIGALLGLMFIDAVHLSGPANIDPLLAQSAYGIWDYMGLVAGAIIGGAIFWWLSWVAVFALGFIGCGFIGFFAFSSIAPGQVSIAVGAVAGILGGVFVVKLFKPFMIVLTAILGAFDFAMGVAAVLVATGFITVLTGNAGAGMWAFIFPFVLMIILGIVNQVLDNYRDEYTPEAPVEEAPAAT